MSDSHRKLLLDDPIEHYPPATVACFDATSGGLPRRRLDVARNRLFLERLAEAGAPAVLIAASTGHGHCRTVLELERWFEESAAAELGATLRMALLRPEDGRGANERLMNQLRQLEYDVIYLRPGADLPAAASDEMIAANLRPFVEMAAERDFPIGVYSIPDVSGVRLTADAAALLTEFVGGSQIVAAKITEAGYARSTLAYLQHPALKRLKIVQGWDPFLARALQDGPRYDDQGRQRVGVTSGPMSFAIFQYLDILAAAKKGDWDEVQRLQAAVTVVFESMQDDPRKFADLQRAKFMMGLGHPLTGEVTEEQTQRVLDALESLTRQRDRSRLAESLDLLQDGPFCETFQQWKSAS